MTPPDIDPAVHHQLGEIAAGMKALQDSIKRVEDAAQRSEDKSDSSRAMVHKRMDELNTHIGEMRTSIAAAKKDIGEMKPVTDDVRKWKLMGMGALGIVGIGGTALGVMLAGTLENIAHFLRGT